MTFREAMIQQMMKRGMFQQQAEQIIDNVINENNNEFMDGRWFENIHAYPDNLVNILWVEIKQYAYMWIEENIPGAWFKPMFQFTDTELKNMIAEKNKLMDEQSIPRRHDLSKA